MTRKRQAYKRKAGQGTTEYILLVTGVMAAIIVLTTGSNSIFQKKLKSTVNVTIDGMQEKADQLTTAIVAP